MDNYNEEVKTTSKVRFSINTPNRSIEVDAENLDEYQVSELLDPLRREARYQRQQHLSETTNNIMMHMVAIAFLTLVTAGASFTASRTLSTMFNQPRTGVVTNVN